MSSAAFPGRKLTLSDNTRKIFQVDYCLKVGGPENIVRAIKTSTVSVLTTEDALDAILQAKRDVLEKTETDPMLVRLDIVNVILIGEETL